MQYTPNLSSNPLLASLQLLAWLLLRPSAWRHHLKQIDPTLPPDLALASLQRHQWRNPLLWRLLLLYLGIYPLWSGIIIGTVVWIATTSVDATLWAVSFGIALTVIGCLVGAIIIAVPLALIASVFAGIVLGIWVGFSVHFSGHIEFNLFTIGVSLFILSVAGNMNNTLPSPIGSDSWGRQIGSILTATIFTILMLLMASYLATLLAKQVFLELLLPRLENALMVFDLAYATLITVFMTIFLSSILKLHGQSWQQSILLGLVFSLLIGTLFVVILHTESNNPLLIGIALGALIAIVASLLFALPYLFAQHLASNWAGVLSGVMVSGSVYILIKQSGYSVWTIMNSNLFRDGYFLSLVSDPVVQTHSLGLFGLIGVVTLLGLTWHRWQAIFLYPFVLAWNLLLYRAEQRRWSRDFKNSFFRWHSVCWDERQYLPLYGLDDYLVTLSEQLSAEGAAAISYVSTTQQRWAAQAAQIELDARRLQNCHSVKSISHAHDELAAGELTGPASSLLRSLRRISQDVAAALEQYSPYHQQSLFKEVEKDLESLLREFTRSSEKYAERFRPIVESWRQLVSAHILECATQYDGEIDNPYVVGTPLSAAQEIFVGRTDISKRLERFLHKPGPPLLLYGQRRIGKTSLLKNLTRLLPSSIVPIFVDLQGTIAGTTNEVEFFYSLSYEMQNSLPVNHPTPLKKEDLNPNPFLGFTQWLDDVKKTLENKFLLLMLDEFEVLNDAFVRGYLDESKILGFFRHLIQHSTDLKILFSGLHALNEFKSWASYLINVQTLHISYLTENEALRLIEQPIADFRLAYTAEARQRVLEVTRCHPYLVQLLCSEIVTLKNEQPIEKRWNAQLDDVHQAISDGLKNGHFFFQNIETELTTADSFTMLRFIAAQGEGACVTRTQLAKQFSETLESSLTNLLQRELIETVEEGYRVQVELIRLWMVQSIDKI